MTDTARTQHNEDLYQCPCACCLVQQMKPITSHHSTQHTRSEESAVRHTHSTLIVLEVSVKNKADESLFNALTLREKEKDRQTQMLIYPHRKFII